MAAQCQERDSFLRGLRAYVGFRQEGRLKLCQAGTYVWYKYQQLDKKYWLGQERHLFLLACRLLTATGGVATLVTVLMAIFTILVRLFDAASVPKGVTFLSLLVMFFGSFTLLGIGLLSTLARSLKRPRLDTFIRRSLIVRGEIRPADQRGQL